MQNVQFRRFCTPSRFLTRMFSRDLLPPVKRTLTKKYWNTTWSLGCMMLAELHCTKRGGNQMMKSVAVEASRDRARQIAVNADGSGSLDCRSL
eukprot:5190373-Amphidinium_carterae.1